MLESAVGSLPETEVPYLAGPAAQKLAMGQCGVAHLTMSNRQRHEPVGSADLVRFGGSNNLSEASRMWPLPTRESKNLF